MSEQEQGIAVQDGAAFSDGAAPEVAARTEDGQEAPVGARDEVTPTETDVVPAAVPYTESPPDVVTEAEVSPGVAPSAESAPDVATEAPPAPEPGADTARSTAVVPPTAHPVDDEEPADGASAAVEATPQAASGTTDPSDAQSAAEPAVSSPVATESPTPAASLAPGAPSRSAEPGVSTAPATEPAPPAPAAPDAAAAPTAPAGPATPAGPAPVAARPAPPRPGPRPSRPSRLRPTDRRPAAPPAAPTAAPQPSPVASASADPARWGRVDAEGVVHVRTTDGERAVGSWQAGEPAEGLAHFARRFDDLATEVELLFHRLTAGSEPKQALGAARTLRDGLAEATVVGDVSGLAARLDELVVAAEAAVAAARSARDAQRAQAMARKEELATEAETLSVDATQWKQAGDRFQEILDEWRAIRGIDRKTDEALWKRFSRAREAFNRRRGSHFADLDRQRAGAKTRKEDLVLEAEKLADSADWGPTAARYRDLMAEWKEAGRAHKDTDDVLWQRFRTAQDTFFAHRAANLAERDAEFAANAGAKRALLTEAEKIDATNQDGARAALRSVQERWEAIGKVPRDDVRPLEARLRVVEDRVRDAAERQWRRTDPEAEARVAQFRERVAQFEAQATKARAAGDAGRAGQADEQAAQWREWLATAEQAVQHR